MDLAQAWDLWREASCAEIDDGVHWWEAGLDPDGADWLIFRCRRCPLVMEAHPVDDEIRSPWGVVFTIVTQPCGYCGEKFRRPAVGSQMPEYCTKAHKASAANRRKKARGKTQRQKAAKRAARQAALALAYQLAAPRLAAEHAEQDAREAREAADLQARCPTPRKRAWNDPADAVAAAARAATGKGRPFRAYRCDPDEGGCGRWHITSRYARSEFIPRSVFTPRGA